MCVWRWGAVAGGLVLLASPALAYAALRFGEEVHDLGEAVRHAGWRLRPGARERMAERRRKLADEVEALLRAVSSGESAAGDDVSVHEGTP